MILSQPKSIEDHSLSQQESNIGDFYFESVFEEDFEREIGIGFTKRFSGNLQTYNVGHGVVSNKIISCKSERTALSIN